MRATFRFAWRVAAFAAVMVVLLVIVVQAIRRPVPGALDSYTALFTDANGLRTGADVRMYGVAVGKVESLTLRGTVAEVRFTAQHDHPLYRGSTLAIRYQTLAGQRYLDIRQPSPATERLTNGSTIGTDRTEPAFDITALFNGLQPVLAEVSPDSVNRFAESVLAVLNGDGNGLGRAVDAIDELARYVGDRQTVVSTLIHNLREMSDVLAGRSPHMIALIGGLADVFTALEQKLQGVVDYAETIPSVLEPLDRLAARLGLSPGGNSDFDDALRAAFPDPQSARDLLTRLPGLLQSLDAMASGLDPAATVCGKGNAPVPAPLAILIAGQRITICEG